MALTALQQEHRLKYIGGSEIAAIIGESQYDTPFDVWMRKTGKVPVVENDSEDPNNEDLSALMGTLLEPVIGKVYLLKHPEARLEPADLVFHPTYPLVGATPDEYVTGILENGARSLLEKKTKSWRTAKGFGATGTDEVPPVITCQAQWQMFATGLQRCDVAVLVDGRQYFEYHLEYDEELCLALYDQATEFWNKHVLTDTPPPLQGRSVKGWLAQQFPKHTDQVRRATPEIEQTMFTLADITKQIKLLEEMKERAQFAIKEFIGDASRVAGESGKASWNLSKDSVKIDTKVLLASLDIAAQTLLEDQTKTGQLMTPEEVYRSVKTIVQVSRRQAEKIVPGSRRFLFTPADTPE